MTINSTLPEICKAAFIKAREQRGLSAKDLGGMACLSHRQIEQIENGESSSFYGVQNKFTAAKKVAKLLELSDEEAFDFGVVLAKKLATEKEAAEAIGRLADTPLSILEIEESQAPVKKVEPKKVMPKDVPFSSAAAKSKPASSKRLFLWFGVMAALAFSVINLRPLFFADKPTEIVEVKEEVIEPAAPSAPSEPAPIAASTTVAPAVATLVVGADSSGVCPAEEVIVNYKPDAPRKAADSVYVQAKSKQVVCVIDVSGKAQNKLLEPGVGASFYGKPPFKVLTAGLNQVDVFFQGAKVRLSNLNAKTVVLEAAEMVSPSVDRTDSQLR